MALTKEDISLQGTGGYGTLSYTPEPGENIEGSAGDILAETATSGIVSSDASAELAGQAPNIVVPVNQSSDSDSDSNSDPYTYRGEFNSDDEATIYADEPTGIKSQIDLGDISRIVSNPTNSAAMNTAIKIALSTASGGILTLPFFLNDQYQRQEAAQQQRIDDAIREVELGKADEAFGDTRIGTGTGDYDEYSDTPTGPVGAQFGDPTYADPIVDAEENQSEPTYTAPAPGPVYYDYSDDNDSSSMSSQDEMDDGGRGSRYAVGGIVRLRKNKQNSRIHDRRKRLAIGGIASLHG